MGTMLNVECCVVTCERRGQRVDDPDRRSPPHARARASEPPCPMPWPRNIRPRGGAARLRSMPLSSTLNIADADADPHAARTAIPFATA